jgi:hypothetical protein
MPALLTRTSRRPSDATVVSIISAIESGLDMSAPEYCTATPNSSASSTFVAEISSGLPKPLSTTADPAAASARAMPRPIPLVEPVIRETRPASGRAAVISLCVSGLFMVRLRVRQGQSFSRCTLRVGLPNEKWTSRGRGRRLNSAA